MKILARFIWLLTLCIAACVQVNGQTVPPGQNDARPLLFRGARVIVGDGRVIDDAGLLVQHGLFMEVGKNGDVKAPAGATEV